LERVNSTKTSCTAEHPELLDRPDSRRSGYREHGGDLFMIEAQLGIAMFLSFARNAVTVGSPSANHDPGASRRPGTTAWSSREPTSSTI